MDSTSEMRANARRLWVPIGLILLLVGGGLWTLFQRSQPTGETQVHADAIRSIQAANQRIQETNQNAPAQLINAFPSQTVLAQLPISPHAPSEHELYLSGDIDPSEGEFLRTDAEIARLREQSRNLPPPSTARVSALAPVMAETNLKQQVGFDAVHYKGGIGALVPPDPEIAAGKDHLVVVSNANLQVFDKSGNALTPIVTYLNFFSSLTGCSNLYDPNVLYDESADRFFVGIAANPFNRDTTAYCAAVSATNDPLGAWHLYKFPMNLSDPGNIWMDYPHAGVGRDAIYVGANLFTANSVKESRIWALDKNAMYQGLPTSAVERGLGIALDTPQPLNLHGYDQGTWPQSGPHFFLAEPFDGINYTLIAWDNPFEINSMPFIISQLDLMTASGVNSGMPSTSPQMGGQPVGAYIDWRPLDFEYRNGHGWTTQTVACNPGQGTVNCVRWAQINLNNGTVMQSGVIMSDGDYRVYPDLATNSCGDMAIGYTKTNGTMYPSIYVSGRQTTDPAGKMQPEMLVKAGDTTYSSASIVPPPIGPAYRWGDYTGMTIDPDGERFWYVGQFSEENNQAADWATHVGGFHFPSCPSAPIADPPPPTPTETPSAYPPEPQSTTIPPIPTPISVGGGTSVYYFPFVAKN